MSVHRGRGEDDLNSDTLWSSGNREYPNPVLLPPMEIPRESKTRPTSPSYHDKDISVNTLMAMLNAKSQEAPPKLRNLYDHPPPLPALLRPQPPIYPLTVLAEHSAEKFAKDPIKTYRKKNYPYLQLFENGTAVFPNFSKSVPLPPSPPPEESKKSNIRKVLAWKYGIPYQYDKLVFHEQDYDSYVKKPKRRRFPKIPPRQMFQVRTGLAFPVDRKKGPYINSIDKAETLQPSYETLLDRKTKRFVADMSEYDDTELTFFVDRYFVEIFGTKKKSKNGNFRQTVEKIDLTKDLPLDQVHFVRDYRRNIVIEERWEFD